MRVEDDLKQHNKETYEKIQKFFRIIIGLVSSNQQDQENHILF